MSKQQRLIPNLNEIMAEFTNTVEEITVGIIETTNGKEPQEENVEVEGRRKRKREKK